MPARLLAACVLLAAVLAPSAVIAQDPGKPPRTYRLEPQKVPDIAHGKASMVRGRTGKAGHRYYVEHLHMMVPVVVTLRPLTPDADLKLEIGKYPWEPPLRQGEVRDGRQLSFSFRTQGEFQLGVSSTQEGTPYKLLVWVGEEIKPALKPVVVPASQYEDGGAGGRGWLSWAGVLVLVVLAVSGAVVIRRRKQA
jgi:hypothetical protein